MPADASTFGDLLRRHRRARGLTQEALAERAHVSARAISDLERGERSHPYRETANLLATALGIAGAERHAFLTAARRSGSNAVPRQHPQPEPIQARPPRPRTPLIGRRAELVHLTHLLGTERQPLVTITGPAGVGKTRLLAEIASGLEDAFSDGVAFVDLAPLVDQPQVERAIADAVGVADQGAIPLVEALYRRLARLRILLLLDNFEHLLPIAPLVSNLLDAAPGVQVLVTSRAPLRLDGEQELPLLPLRTPDPAQPPRLDDILRSDAVQLFAERAAAARPDFQVTPGNAADVIAICRHLDGLPLAIELAAARITLFSPALLLQRLDQRLALLTANRRDAPARQQSLEAAIAWSYDLLTTDEQTLLCAMAVFADGWPLGAAEALGAAFNLPDPIRALAALVEHNLVVRGDAGGAPRYRMLETIHAFARARLLAQDTEVQARQAQLGYFIAFARENDIERLDAQVNARLTALMTESVNLQDVLGWALDHDPDAALLLLAELDYFWYLGDHHVSGRNLLARALDAASHEDSWARGRVLSNAAWLASVEADYARATAYADAAIALAGRTGDAHVAAHAVIVQGTVTLAHEDVPLARAQHEAAIAQCITLGDDWGTMLCVTNYGIAELEWGNLHAAEQHFQHVRAICHRLDLPESYHAHPLNNLADTYWLQGDRERARATAEESVALAHHAVNRLMVMQSQFTLARIMLYQGQHHEAARCLTEYLAYLWDMGERWTLAPCLETAGVVLRFAHQWEAAASLFGAAHALRAALPYPLGVAEREPLAREIAAVQTALGPAAFQRAWQAGCEQPLTGVVSAATAALAALREDAAIG